MRVVFFLLLVAAVLPPGRAQDVRAGKIALKAGRIITVADEEIRNGVILIDGGKILEVGKDLEIPFDFWVIELEEGQVVFPGMIEPHTSRGLDRSNESLPVVPFLSVFDAIDPSNLVFEDALRDGITALNICQGNNTAIGGMARVVRPIGMTVGEMTLKAEAGLKISVYPMRGQDRLTQMAILREAFRELGEYTDNLAESKYEEECKEKKEEIKVPPAVAREKGIALLEEEDFDFKHKNLKKLSQGRLPAFVYCNEAMDVSRAVEIAGKNGFLKRTVFVLGNECWKAVDEIKAAGRPVILDSSMVHREEDPLTGEESSTFVPLVFYEAGVSFAVSTDPNDAYGKRFPWYQAARLVRNGIPRDAALRTITFTAASLLGMGNRLGAIMPGYDATLLVLSGDPLDNATWVESVFIEGELVYEREKDHRLKELLTGEEAGEKAPEEEKPAEGGEEEKSTEETPPGKTDESEKSDKTDVPEEPEKPSEKENLSGVERSR